MSGAVHLAHHWFVRWRGGERAFHGIARLFPDAGVSTLVLNRACLPEDLAARRFDVSWLRGLTPRFGHHGNFLPLFPAAVRSLRVPGGTRLLVSSDASLVKGIRVPAGCRHVCYCYSPPRYLWERAGDYAGAAQAGGLGGAALRVFGPWLRAWDRRAAGRVAEFIAISATVAARIRACYGRDARVVYPPVDVGAFRNDRPRRDFFVTVAELTAYKRVDLAVAACGALGVPLVVIGDGPERARLERMAAPCVRFAGWVPRTEVVAHLETCRGFLHPQVEDFGIAAVEAMAAGAPVIAFRGGGAVETVVEGEGGWFFESQDAGALEAVLRDLGQRSPLDPAGARRRAEGFSAGVFARRFREAVGVV